MDNITTYDSAGEVDADPIPRKAMLSTRVDLEPIGLTEHGQRYRVTYAGETLIESRRNPILCWLEASPTAWRYGAGAR
jgi:hypothetical protein